MAKPLTIESLNEQLARIDDQAKKQREELLGSLNLGEQELSAAESLRSVHRMMKAVGLRPSTMVVPFRDDGSTNGKARRGGGDGASRDRTRRPRLLEAIPKAMDANVSPMGPGELASHSLVAPILQGVSTPGVVVSQMLKALEGQGVVRKIGRGQYELTGEKPSTSAMQTKGRKKSGKRAAK